MSAPAADEGVCPHCGDPLVCEMCSMHDEPPIEMPDPWWIGPLVIGGIAGAVFGWGTALYLLWSRFHG